MVRIGTFQCLKGCHEDQVELFFVSLAGRTRSSHFIWALIQDASEVVSFLNWRNFTQSLAGWLQSWEETPGLGLGGWSRQTMACGAKSFPPPVLASEPRMIFTFLSDI